MNSAKPLPIGKWSDISKSSNVLSHAEEKRCSQECALSHEVLIVEGNTEGTSEQMKSLGGTPYGIAYGALIESLGADIHCTVVYPSEEGADCLPRGLTLTAVDGIVFTGSALNCYDAIPEVTNQIELAGAAYASGTPVFGSCWGLQIMTIARGGKVRRNPKGRELGIGRRIRLNEAGKAHPMYAGKDRVFDALAVHMDEVEVPPAGAVVLAENAMSDVQALALEEGGRSFWGVQYHPEFDFATMAVVMRRLKHTLIDEGLYDSCEAVAEVVSHFESLAQDTRSDCAKYLGLTPSVEDYRIHRLEIANWLRTKILANASGLRREE